MTDASPNMDFTSPDRDRYFEDYEAGAVHVLGQVRVDGAKMLAFSREFDPQDIHIDAAKASEGPFKGLIASGWYTTSLMMRFLARNFLSNVSSLASPGIDGLRWLELDWNPPCPTRVFPHRHSGGAPLQSRPIHGSFLGKHPYI